jgi:hypothetical protein
MGRSIDSHQRRWIQHPPRCPHSISVATSVGMRHPLSAPNLKRDLARSRRTNIPNHRALLTARKALRSATLSSRTPLRFWVSQAVWRARHGREATLIFGDADLFAVVLGHPIGDAADADAR